MPRTLQTIKVICQDLGGMGGGRRRRVGRPLDVYQRGEQRERARGSGSCGTKRSEIADGEGGRPTWGEFFPFPEVTAKYGAGAGNR